MSFAEVGQDEEHCSPNSNEKCNNKKKNLIFGNGYTPQVSPVASVGLGVYHYQIIHFDKVKDKKSHKPHSTNNHGEFQKLRTKGRAFASIMFLGSGGHLVVFVGSNLSSWLACRSSHQ
jgi:hypothetical protein